MSRERENFEKRFDTIEKEVLVLTEGGTGSSRWARISFGRHLLRFWR